MKEADRKQAWAMARVAVRAYSKDPSQHNAERVEAAWAAVRHMDAASHWRSWHVRALDEHTQEASAEVARD